MGKTLFASIIIAVLLCSIGFAASMTASKKVGSVSYVTIGQPTTFTAKDFKVPCVSGWCPCTIIDWKAGKTTEQFTGVNTNYQSWTWTAANEQPGTYTVSALCHKSGETASLTVRVGDYYLASTSNTDPTAPTAASKADCGGWPDCPTNNKRVYKCKLGDILVVAGSKYSGCSRNWFTCSGGGGSDKALCCTKDKCATAYGFKAEEAADEGVTPTATFDPVVIPVFAVLFVLVVAGAMRDKENVNALFKWN